MLVMLMIYMLILESRHGIADNGDMVEGAKTKKVDASGEQTRNCFY
jgi:hypothetical protein